MAVPADLTSGARRERAGHRSDSGQAGHPGERAGDPVLSGGRGDGPRGLEHQLRDVTGLARDVALQERGRLL